MTRRAATLTPLLALLVLASACDKAGEVRPATAPASAESAPETIVFGDVTPAVGMQRERQEAVLMKMTMHVDADGQQIAMPFSSADVEKKREEILAVDGDTVTKLLVTYEAMESRKVDPGGESVERSPVAGKSYVVVRDGEKVTVTRQGKQKTPKAEREAVEKDYRRMGDNGGMCKRLRESPRAIGEAIELGGSEFPGPSGGSGTMTLTLREVGDAEGRETARFAARMSMKGPVDDGELALELSGTLLVDVQTCSASWFEAEGPLAMTASRATKNGTPLKMRGEGQAKFSSLAGPWLAPP